MTRPRPLLSLVICTLDEAASIRGVLHDLAQVLGPLSHELIVVDDSTSDSTAQAVRGAQALHPQIRLIRRPGQRGLASAAIAGWDAAAGQVLGVMDGDGQHDPELVWRLMAQIQAGATDVAIGSRYLDGASGLTGFRAGLSRAGVGLSSLTLGVRVADPMSGIFLMRRSWYEAVRPRLSGIGFKILLDVLVSGERPPRIAQTPTALRPRAGGRSKLGVRVAVELAILLMEKRAMRRRPVASFADRVRSPAP